MKNIRILVLILCACFVSVAWGQQPPCKQPGSWGEFHRTNMQRWNPCENVLNVKNVGNLQVKWKLSFGSFENSSPAVVDGVVYISVGEIYELVALNAATGAELWINVDCCAYSAPAVANGVVYVGSDVGIWAVNASTGALLWSYAAGDYVDSSPAVANGVVYVGSNDKSVYALNASTGAKLWGYTTGGAVTSSPAVANGVVLCRLERQECLRAERQYGRQAMEIPHR